MCIQSKNSRVINLYPQFYSLRTENPLQCVCVLVYTPGPEQHGECEERMTLRFLCAGCLFAMMHR